MIIYFDMDGVLADYAAQKASGKPDTEPGYFLDMEPMPGAVEAFKFLASQHECFILSTAPWSKTYAWSEKRLWVEKHLGEAAFKRLILTHHKELMRGDILIDDRTENGAAEFQGRHIHFGKPPYSNWNDVLAAINDMDENQDLLKQLEREVEKMLSACPTESFPTICQMRKTPEGLAMAKRAIVEKVVSADGVTIAQAMFDLEQEYSINSNSNN